MIDKWQAKIAAVGVREQGSGALAGECRATLTYRDPPVFVVVGSNLHQKTSEITNIWR